MPAAALCMAATHAFFREHSVDHPVSLYAASKKANELMAYIQPSVWVACHWTAIFTVYGPGAADRPFLLLKRFWR